MGLLDKLLGFRDEEYRSTCAFCGGRILETGSTARCYGCGLVFEYSEQFGGSWSSINKPDGGLDEWEQDETTGLNRRKSRPF